MCTMGQCRKYMGQWVQFQTPWGAHRGVVADVNQRAVLMRVPRRYAPVGLATDQQTGGDDAKRLDVALAQWGYAGGYGYRGGYGRPGYGYWYGGWWWWWLAFAWIWALALFW